VTVRRNTALAKLRAGKVVIGPMLVYASPDLAEWAGHLGFDYVWLDWQHGEYTELPLNNAIARTRAGAATPLVRVKGNERGTINRVLDMGAMGVVVPMVETAEEARAAVDAAYYPPRGRRSAGGLRLGMLADGSEDYWYNANPEIMLVVMVESEAAIGRVREIMAVPGIDVVLIGPGDLMIDVKSRGGDEARHEALVLEVAAASKATGVAAGYVCGTEAMAAKRIAQGFRFLNYGLDHAIMMAGLKTLKAEHDRLAGSLR
jgi:2-keto-3-deoxy-L-rhamnonate aldolase RhmA